MSKVSKSKNEIIMNISNLRVTDELKSLGITEANDWKLINSLINFRDAPAPEEIKGRATSLAEIAKACGAQGVLIGNPRSQYMLSEIETACTERGIKIFYPFFVREKIEEKDGTSYFKTKITGLIEKK